MTERMQSSCYPQPMKKKSHPWSLVRFNPTRIFLFAYTKLDANSETKHVHDKVSYVAASSL